MDDKKDINVDWENYYSSVDKTTLSNLCSNNNIKNLIYLSSQMDINPFNKKNKKWQLKNKEKIIKECEQFKKKEIKDFSYVLSNLAKLGTNNTSDVKHIYKSFEDKLENIDKIITCVNNITTVDTNVTNVTNVTNKTNKTTKTSEKTTYLVDHDLNSQSNIVSFDIIGGSQEEKVKQKPNKTNSHNKIDKPKKPDNKIVEIKIINNIKTPSESSDNEDYLECYGNC
jgi:hypothetical protein